MVTNPRKRRSEQVFLFFPEKLRKGSYFFPELELIITMKSLFNPLSTLWFFILSSLCIDCVFSSSCLNFNPTCSIRSLILLELVLEIGAFNITGKKSSFLFLTTVCFYLNHILSNTSINFVNNFQLIKYCSETILLPNIRS